MGGGVHLIGPCDTDSNSAWRATNLPHPSRPQTRRAGLPPASMPLPRPVSTVGTAVRACWSCSACSHDTRQGHHEPQNRRVVSPCRPHRGRRFPDPWPPPTRVPSCRTPWPKARFPLALRPSDPIWRQGPHPSAHLGGSPLLPPSSHECASQEARAVLKFHTSWSRGSVQPSFCVGCAPQKLFFVRPSR
jgi:hypothetical protein